MPEPIIKKCVCISPATNLNGVLREFLPSACAFNFCYATGTGINFTAATNKHAKIEELLGA
jgi:hypothetical protein